LSKTPDTIRQGVVSSVNYDTGRVRVLYEDKNNAVTAELPLLTFEYDMPKVGEQVYVAHQSNGVENGVVLCRYWRDGETPVESGPQLWRKELRDDSGSHIKFDRDTHTLFVDVADSPDVSVSIKAAGDVAVKTAKNVSIEAEYIKIKGKIEHEGDYESTGKVKAVQGEFGPDGQTVTITTHKHKGVTTGTSNTSEPVRPS
jgi:phage baseplate assembly protein V